MKLMMAVCAAAALGGCVSMNPMGMATDAAMASSISSGQAQTDNMLAAQAAAQQAAIRPGDDAMTCDAMQAEMATTMNDPAVQAAIAQNGAMAQQQMDKAKGAQGTAIAGAAATSALGIAGSFIPGLNFFSQGAMMAQQAAMAGQMKQADKDRAVMVGNVATMMPQLMRGQRIYDLATAKKCAFLTQAGATKPS